MATPHPAIDPDTSPDPSVAGAWAAISDHVVAPTSVEDLWTEIGTLTFGVGLKTTWVFRGVPDARWRMQSALVRSFLAENGGRLPTEGELQEHEDALYERAREWAIGMTPAGVADNVHVLSLMQHHGIPTRLLDVTSNPMTALWFACRRPPAAWPPCQDCQPCSRHREIDDSSSVPGVLLALKTTGLDSYLSSAAAGDFTWADLRDLAGARWSAALATSTTRRQPFVIRPSNPDARMQAQEGLFLTSAAPSPEEYAGLSWPLDCLYPPTSLNTFATDFMLSIKAGRNIADDAWPGFSIRPFIIRPTVKRDLLKALNSTFNRSDRTMFPDLSGFAASLGERPLRKSPAADTDATYSPRPARCSPSTPPGVDDATPTPDVDLGGSEN